MILCSKAGQSPHDFTVLKACWCCRQLIVQKAFHRPRCSALNVVCGGRASGVVKRPKLDKGQKGPFEREGQAETDAKLEVAAPRAAAAGSTTQRSVVCSVCNRGISQQLGSFILNRFASQG